MTQELPQLTADDRYAGCVGPCPRLQDAEAAALSACLDVQVGELLTWLVEVTGAHSPLDALVRQLVQLTGRTRDEINTQVAVRLRNRT